ncbi:rhodanese-like domain-containing protein [Halorussus salilacus]|uniref:MBL fold metallo-hydrolase n=1 Tax=Halorussus salilacus TaxID=2953750 RepID=UPI0020A065A6|nr:rhodanese-like domain-containing protein [Halorussus salilacus]USZ69256.1 rhodanese-like domain-containing protein [Halorussus salilacus]
MPAKVTPERLADMLDTGEEFVLLDTRPEESYEAWHVPGAEHFPFDAEESLSDGRTDDIDALLDGHDRIVTICAKGISSDHFADELGDAGYDDVAVVTGGMEAWSQVYETVPVPTEGRAQILQVQRRAKGCLGYVVADPVAGEAAVVDPTRHAAEFRAPAAERDWEITRVFDTHVHADHVSGGRKLAEELGVPYHLGAAARERGVEYEFEPLDRNEVVEVGDVQIKAVGAPGHTTEMVNYLVGDEALLTGDTLFVDSVGRTELEFGDDAAAEGARMQYESLHRTLLAEPDTVAVLPGHVDVNSEGEFSEGRPGEPVASTVGDLRTGLDLLGLSGDEFVERLTDADHEKPPNYEEVIAINLGIESVEADEATELEMGPNRCSA